MAPGLRKRHGTAGRPADRRPWPVAEPDSQNGASRKAKQNNAPVRVLAIGETCHWKTHRAARLSCAGRWAEGWWWGVQWRVVRGTWPQQEEVHPFSCLSFAALTRLSARPLPSYALNGAMKLTHTLTHTPKHTDTHTLTPPPIGAESRAPCRAPNPSAVAV